MPDFSKILLLLILAALAFWALHKRFQHFEGPFDKLETVD